MWFHPAIRPIRIIQNDDRIKAATDENWLYAMTETATAPLWRFGDWELDERVRELRCDGAAAEIEPKSFDLLLVLLQHAGEIVTIEEFQGRVWPGRIVAESAVTNIVSKLRRLLGDDNQELIRTIPKAGYRFMAPVQRDQARRGAAVTAVLKAGDPVPGRDQWRLLEVLSGGSHRDVWLAEHGKTREKRVFKFCFDNERLPALKREVTLYRLLQDALDARDGYVRILEWNFESPPWFIESAYAGRNLRDWLDVRGGGAAVPLGERIELIAVIAEELAAAHSIGVLHKDLKPENVLIEERDGGKRARLGDFGAGRLLDAGQLAALGITQLGFTQSTTLDESTTGTLIYLAPELFSGTAASVQSDIYSLGVLLYHLITGQFGAPLAPGWEADIEDELLRQDIADATQGNCERRLPSAQLLAQRLRSLEARRAELHGRRAEEARAAAAFEAIKRAEARRPWLIVAGLAILAGVAVGSYLFVQKQHQVQMTAALNQFLNEDILQAADPRNGGSKDMTLLAAIRQSVPHIEQRFAGQPEIEAAVEESLGVDFEDLSEYSDALKAFQREVTLYTTLYGAEDVRTLMAQVHVSEAMIKISDLKSGAALFRHVFPKLVHRLDANDPRALYARLVETEVALRETKIEESLVLARRLVADCRRTMPDNNLTSAAERTYLIALANSGDGGAEEFEAEAKRQLDLAVRRSGASDFRSLTIRIYLGRALMSERRYEEAEVEFSKALEGLTRLVGADHEQVAFCNYGLSTLYSTQRRWDKAALAAEAAWRWAQHALGEKAVFTIQQQTFYANALDNIGRSGEALSLAQAAYDQATQSLDPSNIIYVDTRYTLGFIDEHGGHLMDARRIADEFRNIVGVQHYADHPELREWVGSSHFLDAKLARDSGDSVAARREAMAARELYETSHDLGSVADVDDFLKSLDVTTH